MEVRDRFTNRADNYGKYRPHYPAEVYAYLRAHCLPESGVVADIGCGTGISAKLFLENGHKVFGVEPNETMLNAAKTFLNNFKNFVPVSESAENTGLPASSVDLIVVAQTFHWLDKEKSRTEFKRILKPGGYVVLMWNDRRTNSTEFLKIYEDFLKLFGTDYKEVDHKNTQKKEVFDQFFRGTYTQAEFENRQLLNWEGLKGRVLSSSYMPDESHRDYEFMIYCLRKIFNRYQHNDQVSIEYDTRLYTGQLN